ncbi:MAG TPA: hypothetical protein VFK10_00140 [Burkholderiaceae bacterium]|nr:hypothetical protein [Burkholderiaceae bacterium]
MEQRHRRMLYRVEVTAAVVGAGLFVLTCIDPQWIEMLFDESPDGGDGNLERWLLLTSTFVVAVIATVLARRERRLLQAATY